MSSSHYTHLENLELFLALDQPNSCHYGYLGRESICKRFLCLTFSNSAFKIKSNLKMLALKNNRLLNNS